MHFKQVCVWQIRRRRRRFWVIGDDASPFFFLPQRNNQARPRTKNGSNVTFGIILLRGFASLVDLNSSTFTVVRRGRKVKPHGAPKPWTTWGWCETRCVSSLRQPVTNSILIFPCSRIIYMVSGSGTIATRRSRASCKKETRPSMPFRAMFHG